MEVMDQLIAIWHLLVLECLFLPGPVLRDMLTIENLGLGENALQLQSYVDHRFSPWYLVKYLLSFSSLFVIID